MRCSSNNNNNSGNNNNKNNNNNNGSLEGTLDCNNPEDIDLNKQSSVLRKEVNLRQIAVTH